MILVLHTVLQRRTVGPSLGLNTTSIKRQLYALSDKFEIDENVSHFVGRNHNTKGTEITPASMYHLQIVQVEVKNKT